MDKLSDVIDARLKEIGIPGSKMCDDLHISRSTLTELRKGRSTTLKAEKAAAIASYLGLSVEELIGKEKLPTQEGERKISDADIKFALWGDSRDIDDEDLEDVRRYAAFVAERKKKKQ